MVSNQNIALFVGDLFKIEFLFSPFFFRIVEQHPFINDDLPNRILCGSVIVKPNVREFTADGHGVMFDDGSKVDHIDCVLMATGFSIAFPYLDEKILTAKDNQVRISISFVTCINRCID